MPFANLANDGLGEEVRLDIQRLPTMNGKPRFEIKVRSVLNYRSDFGYKRLCDYLTFSLGSACVAKCAYCYVESMVRKHPQVKRLIRALKRLDLRFEDVAIVRCDALRILRDQLTIRKPPGVNLAIKRVIYTSPLVDPALNPQLADQTLAACLIILELTNWDVRILSKGNFLRRIAEGLPERFRDRVIFGHSTGILGDACAAIEAGTATLARRIADHHWLQEHGFRTFGMLCPILPCVEVDNVVARLAAMIRVERCEEVWAEVINLRGESMRRTQAALRASGQAKLVVLADEVRRVIGKNSQAWEEYARRTFEACTNHVPAEKLRFLQYPSSAALEWWAGQRDCGAVLLGKVAERANLSAAHPYWLRSVGHE